MPPWCRPVFSVVLSSLLGSAPLLAQTHPARVQLPARADASLRIETPDASQRLDVLLEGASSVPGRAQQRQVLFDEALGRGSIVRLQTEVFGVEDFVHFSRQPAREELSYLVSMAGVDGLRLVDHGLEFLDASGTPRLRMAPPYINEEAPSASSAHRGRVVVEGCAFDTSPAPPWGRPITPPGSAVCRVRVLWSGIPYPLVVDPAWSLTQQMVFPREDHVLVPLPGDRAMAAGGFSFPQGIIHDSAEIFDAATQTWSLTAPLPGPRLFAAAISLKDGRVLLSGGRSNEDQTSAVASAQIFEPSTGQWAPTPAMNHARSYHTLTELPDGRVLAIGGRSSDLTPDDQAEVFASPGKWQPFGGAEPPRYLHSAITLQGGGILVAGGVPCSGCPGLLETRILQPEGTWVAGPTLPELTVVPVGGALPDGRAWLLAHSGALLWLSPGASSWVTGPSLGTSWFGVAATHLASGELLFAGGHFGQLGPSVEVRRFLPSQDAWLPGPPLQQPRRFSRGVLLSSGQALVAGGVGVNDSLASAEILLLLAQGESCSGDGFCQSGHCADSVCCDTPCGGLCVACTNDRTGLVSGQCAPVVAGTDPDAECEAQATSNCQTGACDGTGACGLLAVGTPCGTGACEQGVDVRPRCTEQGVCDNTVTPCAPYPCAADGCATNCGPQIPCVQGFCAPSGQCQGFSALGNVCQDGGECESGFCVDGVCCESVCAGICEACSKAKGSLVDGQCRPVPDGSDPDQECEDQGVAACSQDGNCNGQGACRLFPPQTLCDPATCQGSASTGFVVVEGRCAGVGACETSQKDCGLYGCGAGSCLSSCKVDADCSGVARCLGGQCSPKNADGTPCAEAAACLSGQCVDGVCCESACSGACEACNEPDAAGACVPVSGEPRAPRAPCPQGSPAAPCSAARCDGVQRALCGALVGPLISCGSASCEGGGVRSAGACDGQGSCTPGPLASCEPFVCREGRCLDACASDADCSAGSRCDPEAQRCVAPAICDGEHTLTRQDGSRQDCSPYRCSADGRCFERCTSSSQCLQGLQCNASGVCDVPAAPVFTEAQDEGGCGCRLVGGEQPSRWPLVLLLALAGCRRRLRRGTLFGLLPWIPVDTPPIVPISDVRVTLLDERVVFLGGRCGWSASDWVLIFEPATRTWSVGPPLPMPRVCHAATLLDDGRVLVAGGRPTFDDASSATFLWEPGSGAGWQPGPPLLTPREKFHLVRAPAGILVVGGYNASAILQGATELGDGILPWTPAGAVSTPRLYFGSVMRSGGVAVVGGLGEGDSVLASCEQFSPGVGWSPGPALLQGRYLHAATVLEDETIFVAGGLNNGVLSSVEWLPAGAASWQALPPLPSARREPFAIPLPGKRILVLGGEANDPQDPGEAFVFSRTTLTWSTAGSPPNLGVGLTAAPSADGTSVLLAGRAKGALDLPAAALFQLLDTGAPCSSYPELCASGFCVDGVCCESACQGPCRGCSKASTGQNDGACAQALSGKDPHDDCDNNPLNPCGEVGLCDGQGGCLLASSGLPCGAASCEQEVLLVGTCDGLGSCVASSTSCAPFGCLGGACLVACGGDGDCSPLAWCKAGSCLPRGPLGAPCEQAGACLSGQCVDGVCCDGPCAGLCEACSALWNGKSDGTCSPAVEGTDPDEECAADAPSSCLRTGSCDGQGACALFPPQTPCKPPLCAALQAGGLAVVDGQCDGAGSCVARVLAGCGQARCEGSSCLSPCESDADCLDEAWCEEGVCLARLPLGQPCSSASSCLSGFCVDGVCCTGPCSGRCEACSEPDTPGTCRAVSGAPRGTRLRCAEAPEGLPCAARSCDGTERFSCDGFAGDDVPCSPPSCSGGQAILEGVCDGKGACATPRRISCGAYGCAGEKCATSCVNDAGCAPGSVCQVSSGRCVSTERCDEDGHTVVRVSGEQADCAPYRCTPEGTCRQTCSSGAHCVAGSRCDASGACVPPPQELAAGCGCAVPGRERGGAWSVWLVLACAVQASRRRSTGRYRLPTRPTPTPPDQTTGYMRSSEVDAPGTRKDFFAK